MTKTESAQFANHRFRIAEADDWGRLLDPGLYRQRLPEILGLAVLYYLTARLGQVFAIAPGNVTPVWIPSGICLAAILVRGYGLWPGIFLGAFAGNVWAYIDWSSGDVVARSIFTGTFNGLGDVLGAAGAAYLIQRTTGVRYPFGQATHVFRFVLFGALLGPSVSAAFGILTLCVAGFMPWADCVGALFTWWTGDGVGVLVVAPILLAAAFPLHGSPSRPVGQVLFFSAAFVVFAAMVLGVLPTPLGILLPVFSLAPVLIFMAFVFNQRIVFSAIFLIGTFAIVARYSQLGPFARPDMSGDYIVMQWFLAVMSITIGTLSSTVSERRRAQQSLAEAHHRLEERVAERTRELQDSYEALQREMKQRVAAEESRKKIEAQLHHAHKQEALGTLAGGVAHDFNNILMAVMGFNELARLDAPEGSNLEENLRSTHQSLLRARDLVRRILLFAKKSDGETRPVPVHAVVVEVVEILRGSLPATIDIRTNLEGRPYVLADPSQLHQVLMNLCTNAFRAMGEGGLLEIGLQDVTLREPLVGRGTTAPSGDYAVLTVADNGRGIAPDVLGHIFDPFFTTGRDSGGTGLGLSVVQGVVEAAGGTIVVESEVGVGTEFRVYLPVTAAVGEEPVLAEPPARTGEERILFVDDESDVAQVAEAMLGRLGYRVVAFTNSTRALEHFRVHAAEFDLVITDLTMPNLAGDKLAIALKEIRDDIPILMCSGYSDRMEEEESGPLKLAGRLSKPLTREELATAVRHVLDGDAE